MTAPSEAEIRELVAEWFADTGRLNGVGVLSDAFNDAVSVLDELYETEEMRPSERDALDMIAHAAMVPIRAQAVDDLREAMILAGVRFAAEHPDTPRPLREPPQLPSARQSAGARCLTLVPSVR